MNKLSFSRFSLLFLAVGFIVNAFTPWGSLPASAQENAGITMNVQAGYDGFYKSRFWVPVHITVANQAAPIEGTIRVLNNNSSTSTNVIQYNTPISLPTQSNKRITTYVRIDRILTNLKVQLLNEKGDVVLEARSNSLRRLGDNDLLYGVLTSAPDEFSLLEDTKGGRPEANVAAMEIEQLPAITVGWQALDILIVNDVDSGELNSEQLTALWQWVEGGGQLVVTGGTNWQKTTAAFVDKLPVSINGIETAEDLPALSNFAQLNFRDPGPYTIATSSLRNGELLLHQDGLPLLAKNSFGRGSVYFLAPDPQLAPLVDWDGSKPLWALIADDTPRLPLWADGAKNSYAAYDAVESLPSLALPSTLQLATFLGAYVLLIGPINYYLLRRAKRRELAWLTIPGIILFFTGLAYLIGFQVKGNDVIVNQMNVVYGYVDAETARVQSIVGVYSPRRDRFDITLPKESAAQQFDRNFGSTLGSSGNGTIVRSNEVTVENMRVDVSGVEVIMVNSYQTMPAIAGSATLQPDGSSFKIEVQIQNNSNLTLENATLLFGNHAFLVGNLEPNESYNDSHKLSLSSGSSSSSGYGGSSPLAPQYGYLLEGKRTSSYPNYYNDPEKYPRWRFLESLTPDYSTGTRFIPNDTLTLIFWAKETQLDVQLNQDEVVQLGDSIYFLELPLNQQSLPANRENITIPATMLSTELLDSNQGYDIQTPYNFYLNGWAKFEYVPAKAFQGMVVQELSIFFDYNSSSNPPDIRIWDWSNEDWDNLPGIGKGSNDIEAFAPYLDDENRVRLHIDGGNSYGTEIQALYPKLTGNLP